MHMYVVGILTLAQLLVYYPAENATSIVVKVVVQQQAKGDTAPNSSAKGK